MEPLELQIEQREKELIEMFGVDKITSNYDKADELVTSTIHYRAELSHEELEFLTLFGETLIKSSGDGLRITIKYYL